MNPDDALSANYMMPLAMGSVTPNTYYRVQAEQERERRAIGSRKATLHEAAVARRRKRKRGGPR